MLNLANKKFYEKSRARRVEQEEQSKKSRARRAEPEREGSRPRREEEEGSTRRQLCRLIIAMGGREVRK